MGFFSRFEGRIEDTFEGAAEKLFDSPISPVQIAKKAEREMRRSKMVGAGKQYAPTLYTVLVNPEDDAQLFGYYPTLAGETETYLSAKAQEFGFVMDGNPLVRFIVDDDLRRGKFDIIAELVSRPIVSHLRQEEMQRYGLASQPQKSQAPYGKYSYVEPQTPAQNAQAAGVVPGFIPSQDAYGEKAYDGPIFSAPIPGSEAEAALDQSMAQDFHFTEDAKADAPDYSQTQLPYVPEEEIDRSINYGEYTFDSQDFFDAGREALGAHGAVSAGTATSAAHGAYGTAKADANNAVAGSHVSVAGGISTHAGQSPDVTMMAAPITANANPAPAQTQELLIDLTSQKRYVLQGNVLTIGRDTGNTIVVSDLNASRNHAELRRNAQGTWVLTDLNSTNGTKLNAQRISSSALKPGDRITIGVTNYSYRVI